MSEDERMAAELQAKDVVSIIGSWKPTIMSSGLHSREEVEEMMESVRDQLENVRVKQYVRVRRPHFPRGPRADLSDSGSASGLFMFNVSAKNECTIVWSKFSNHCRNNANFTRWIPKPS